jgi:hypothetical protein
MTTHVENRGQSTDRIRSSRTSHRVRRGVLAVTLLGAVALGAPRSAHAFPGFYVPGPRFYAPHVYVPAPPVYVPDPVYVAPPVVYYGPRPRVRYYAPRPRVRVYRHP